MDTTAYIVKDLDASFADEAIYAHPSLCMMYEGKNLVNKAGYMATPVAFGWPGEVFEAVQ